MLKESSQYKGFFKSDLFEDLVFSEDGNIINEKEHYCYLRIIHPRFRYYCFEYKTNIYLFHRLIAMVFHYSTYEPGKIVNHKDGNKTNNHKDNLEWCTYSENSFHAYMTGLRTDNKIVFVKDLRTKEITEYYSQWEAARFLNVNAGIICNYLKTDRNLPFRHFWSLWTKDLAEIHYSEEQMQLVRKGLPKTVIVEIFDDLNVYMFSSIVSAAEHYNIKCGTLRLWINDGFYHGKIRVWYIHDYKENKEFTAVLAKPSVIEKTNIPPTKPPIPIVVTNTLTGEIKEYPSSQLFADQMKAKKNTIQKRVYETNGFWKHYHLKYLRSNVMS